MHFRRHPLEQNGDVSVNDISYFRRFNRKVPNGVKQEIEERDGFGGACGSQKETSNGIKDGPSHNCSHTVWHEIFAGVYFREFHGFSDDSRKLNPTKINSRKKKFRGKFTPFI